MKRQMLRFLQKRKFRLVTRWKAALKENIGFQLPSQHEFPFALIFRAFDDTLRMLKDDALETERGQADSFLAGIDSAEAPSADQYMELFLTGRDVLGEFITSDDSFCARFSEQERLGMRAALERVFKHLIDREMREFARRQSASPDR